MLVIAGAETFVAAATHHGPAGATIAAEGPGREPSAPVAATSGSEPAVVPGQATTLAPTATPTSRSASRSPHTASAPARRATSSRSSAPGSTTAQPPAAANGRIQFGQTYTGRATFYAADGGGNCSFPPSTDLMVGAMNQQQYDTARACGDYLAVTGPAGNSIRIRIVDRCPECPPGAIDLSAQAFARLATPSTGEITITWHLVSPRITTPISYVYKTGSSRYWCGIQVRNHRNPIAALAVLVNGRWTSLPRQDYDYFLARTGAGCGSSIRVTDIAGHQLTDTGITISPGKVQPGHAQFPAG